MATNKKMNLGNLKTLDNKKHTQKKIIVGDFEVLVDEVFRETKMLALLKEVLEKFEYIREKNLTVDFNEYSLILFIKYFTDIEVPDEFEKQIQLFNILLDLGYFADIINAFSQEEIAKFTEKIKMYGDNINKMLDEFKEEAKEKDDVEVIENA